jgi:hypothetical protein
MATSFAALLFPTAEVDDGALSHGFAVALAGWDVPSPTLTVSEIRALPGWSVAFYRSGLAKGARGALEEREHAAELFADELPPALAVRDAAGAAPARLCSIVFAEDEHLDDAVVITPDGFERRFVREGEDGLEAGRETPEGSDVEELADDVDDAALKPLRGSTFLSAELGVPVLPTLVAALWDDGRRVPVRFADPGPASVAAWTRRLVSVLRRTSGRGAPDALATVAGVAPPETVRAFAAAYDWADPADPKDLYREIAIGAVEGTLRFLRPADVERLAARPAFGALAARGLYPVAGLATGGLAASVEDRWLSVGPDGEALLLATAAGAVRPAGPTWIELIMYLYLGYKKRDDVEEDLVEALMLRAKLRSEA